MLRRYNDLVLGIEECETTHHSKVFPFQPLRSLFNEPLDKEENKRTTVKIILLLWNLLHKENTLKMY